MIPKATFLIIGSVLQENYIKHRIFLSKKLAEYKLNDYICSVFHSIRFKVNKSVGRGGVPFCLGGKDERYDKNIKKYVKKELQKKGDRVLFSEKMPTFVASDRNS